MPHKPGDVVTIYQDPLTERSPEGEATLLEKIDENEDTEQWLVEFGGKFAHVKHLRRIRKSSNGIAELKDFMFKYDGVRTEDVIFEGFEDELPIVLVRVTPLGNQPAFINKYTKVKTGIDKRAITDLEAQQLMRARAEEATRETRAQVRETQAHENGMHSYSRTLICTIYDRFLEEEQNGITKYQDLLTTITKAIDELPIAEPSVVREVLKEARAKVNRIIAEERTHVDAIKLLKSHLCPGGYEEVSASREEMNILARIIEQLAPSPRFHAFIPLKSSTEIQQIREQLIEVRRGTRTLQDVLREHGIAYRTD